MSEEGKIIFESPVFTGNAMRTLFTRRNKNRQEEVMLPADPSNQSAKSLMDTLQTILDENYVNLFRNDTYRREFQSDRRTYNKILNLSFSNAVIQNNTQKFFDLKQGICINRDTQSMIPGRNYSIEAVFKGSEFNFTFNLPSDKRNEALVMLNEWREGRFFFGGGKSRGLGWGRVDIPEWDNLKTGYSKPQNYNQSANYFEINLKLPLNEPLLINWNYGIFMSGGVYHYDNEGLEHGNKINEYLDSEERHQEMAEEAKRNGNVRDYQDPLTGKVIKFVNKENFVKAAQNDRNIINFFKTYGEDIKRFIDNNYKDYRETEKKPDNNTGYGSKEYDKFPIRVKNGNNYGSICIPGSTLKGAFRARAQQIIETLFEQRYHCKVCKKFGTQDDQCMNEQRVGKCICCSMFGGQHDGQKDKKILFIDAYPDNDSKIHLYPADSVPVDRLSGKSLNKSNLLFAYNPEAFMKFRIVLRNIKEDEKWMITLLGHILEDLSEGDIPIGSGKFAGLGRLKGQVENIKVGCHSDSWLYNDIGKDKFQSGFFWDEALLTGDVIRTFLGKYQTDFLNVTGQPKFNIQNQQQQNFQNRGGYRNGR
jgi:CRISPR/Cas system CSM-associated protein Csm3 (group 7 of RAMP superfamily)